MSSNPSPRLRLGALAIVVLSLFAVMFARLWYLQVLSAPTAQKLAENNRIRLVPEPAPRGRILDRQGRVLVDNRVTNVVTVDRAEVKHRAEVLARLAALLHRTKKDLESRLNDQRYSLYRPVPVGDDVDKSVVVYINEHQDLFPGVAADQVAQREYPNLIGGPGCRAATAPPPLAMNPTPTTTTTSTSTPASTTTSTSTTTTTVKPTTTTTTVPQASVACGPPIGAHLLGYVGEITDKELAKHKGEGYQQGDDIGKTGIEAIYEHELRGRPGLLKLEVDSKGKVLRTLGERPPVQGNDVQLTVDLDLQTLAEESLQMTIDAARKVYNRETGKNFLATGGAVVVLDPRDGSVRALASNPTYDPAKFVNGISTADYTWLQDPANNYPLSDKAVMGLYAPGSTFKLATATAALRSGLISAGFTYNDTGSFTLKNCKGACSRRNSGGHAYGPVALPKAISVSSDVYFYNLGAMFYGARGRLGEAPIQDTARDLGFGVSTGSPLPDEATGRVADPAWRRAVHEKYKDAYPEGRWFLGDNINIAIGQGDTVVTPLQLAEAYSTFANGGTAYKPRLATGVKDRQGRPVKEIAPEVGRTVALPAAVREPILSGLVGAVQDPKGTANAAFAGFPLDQFGVAGKTGTAQVHGKQDTALFVGFGPVNDPQYVVSVVIEQGGFGGEAAAPVARRIFDAVAGRTPAPIVRASGVD